MLRFVLSVVALTGGLAVAHPVSADQAAATAFDFAQAPAVAEQSLPRTPARALSDAQAPTGFGWG
jgi:hypothetical protein